MKKAVLLATLAVPTLLVTGCASKAKTLTCTLTEDAGGATTTSVMDMKFNSKGDQVESINMDITIDYDEEYKSYASVFKQTLESQKTNLEDIGYEVKITSGDSSVSLNAKGTNKTLDASESTGTYEATKKSLEDSGYVCK